MIKSGESNRGLLVAWTAAMLLVVLSVVLKWMNVFVDHVFITRLGVSDLGWRGAVYVIGILVLLALALYAVVTRGVLRRIIGGVGLAAAVAVIVDIGLILAMRHEFTMDAGTISGGGAGSAISAAGITVADIHDGGLQLGLVGALLLLLVLLLALSGRHRPIVGFGYGVLLAVVACVSPWWGVWLVNPGSVTYMTYGVLTDPIVGTIYLVSMSMLIGLTALALRQRQVLLTIATGIAAVVAFELVFGVNQAAYLAADQVQAQDVTGVDEFATGVAMLAVLVLAGAAISGRRQQKLGAATDTAEPEVEAAPAEVGAARPEHEAARPE